MTDLLAGTEVRALDFPASTSAEQTSQTNNISSTSYIEPSNQCRITFVAPTTGRVKLITGAGMCDNTNDFQIYVAPEVRETDVSGAVVLSPAGTLNGVSSSPNASKFEYHSRVYILEGLTPGSTYFARLMIKVSGGNTADLQERTLIAVAVP